jgi:hypothetical protein
MPSKKNPAERFRELAAAMPEWPTSLLATAHVPAVSAQARKAAQLMVGALGADRQRVDRVAASLDRLVELNQASASGKQNRGSGR